LARSVRAPGPADVDQRAAVIGIQSAVEPHVTGRISDRVDIGLAVQRDADFAEPAVDVEFRQPEMGGGWRRAIHGETRLQFGRRHARRRGLKRFRGCGRKARQHRQHRPHVGRGEIDADAALRRGRHGVDATAGGKRRAAEIGDRELVDLQAIAIDLEPGTGVARHEAADGGAADIGGNRHVLRPGGGGARDQRLAEGERGIDVEFGRVEFGVELGRPPLGGEHVEHAASDRLAVELGAQPFDRDAFAAERDFAAQTERPQIGLRRFGAAFEPGRQRLRVGGIDFRGPGEGDVVVGNGDMAAEPDLREARRAEFEALQIPAAGIGRNIAAHVLHGVVAERDLIDADADLDREGRPERAAAERHQLADDGGRQRAAAVGGRQRAVEIDLAAGHQAVEARIGAELEVGDAGESQPLLFRAVDELDFFKERRLRAGLELAVNAPGLRHGLVHLRRAAQADADRARHDERAVKARLAVAEHQGAGDIDAERKTDRIDVKLHARAGLLGVTAGREPERIELAADADGTFALDRADQRARLAVEPQPVERHGRAIGSVGQRHRAVDNAEPVDDQRVGIERHRDAGGLDAARRVEAERHLRPIDLHVGGAPFGPQQRPERELDAERPRAHGVGVAADLDLVEGEPRRRQQAGVDGAGDPRLHPDQPAGLLLKQ